MLTYIAALCRQGREVNTDKCVCVENALTLLMACVLVLLRIAKLITRC